MVGGATPAFHLVAGEEQDIGANRPPRQSVPDSRHLETPTTPRTKRFFLHHQQVDVRIRFSVISGPGSEYDDTLGMNLIHHRGNHTIEHVLVDGHSRTILAPSYSTTRPAFSKIAASTSSDLMGSFVMRMPTAS